MRKPGAGVGSERTGSTETDASPRPPLPASFVAMPARGAAFVGAISASQASASSTGFAYRRSRCRAIARATIDSSAAGSSGRSTRRGVTLPCRIARMRSLGVVATKGGVPASAS